MKVTAIGDVHGRNDWVKIVQKESDSDKFVFIGDYFDSFNIMPDQQIDNFKDIQDFYRDNQDKVVLLIGNHDFHYTGKVRERCTGYQFFHAYMIKHLVSEKGLLLPSYAQDGVLYSHAGYSPSWGDLNGFTQSSNAEELSNQINEIYQSNPHAFEAVNSGRSLIGSPFWIRPNYLIDSVKLFPKVENIKQVFGHTYTSAGVIQHTDNLYCIDCIEQQYLVVNDGEIEIKNV